MLSISIVTPSFNQAAHLPACIDSVAHQSHPPIEHLVFDPGSTDGSLKIARDAASVTLINEPDAGQADAVAKGMRAARGDIIGWLNSDDIYASTDVFADVVARFEAEDRPDIVYGRGTYINEDGTYSRDAYVNEKPASLGIRLHHEVGILQPTVFFRRTALQIVAPPREHLNFAMDYDLWIRAALAGLRFAFLPKVLASGRYYLDNKTMGMRGDSYNEAIAVSHEHYGATHVRWARGLARFTLAGADGILDEAPQLDEAAVDTEAARLVALHNYPATTRQVLAHFHDVEPYKETVEFMNDHDLPLKHHARPAASDELAPGFRSYNVDGKTWEFRSSWVNEQMERTQTVLEDLRQSRRSDTCVIAGNGPSLNQTDMSLLDEVDTFVSNFAHLKADLFERATYLSVVNNLVAEQGAATFNQLDSVTTLVPWWLSYCIAPSESTLFLPSVGHPTFSTDLMDNVSWRHTVSFFAMQLAYGLGFDRVALIGFDHSYKQDSIYAEGETIVQESDDQNHFDPNYFKAKSWHAADVDNMEAMYRLADEAFTADGREIVNCTVGGHLELFERRELMTYLADRATR